MKLSHEWQQFRLDYTNQQKLRVYDQGSIQHENASINSFSSVPPPPPPPLPLTNTNSTTIQFKKPLKKSPLSQSNDNVPEESDSSLGNMFSNLMQELTTAKLKSGVMDLMMTPRKKYQELKNSCLSSLSGSKDVGKPPLRDAGKTRNQMKSNDVYDSFELSESSSKHSKENKQPTRIMTRNQKKHQKIQEAGQLQKEKL